MKADLFGDGETARSVLEQKQLGPLDSVEQQVIHLRRTTVNLLHTSNDITGDESEGLHQASVLVTLGTHSSASWKLPFCSATMERRRRVALLRGSHPCAEAISWNSFCLFQNAADRFSVFDA